MERKKNKDPWLAVCLTAVIPGLGHLYLKKILRGIAFIILGIVISFVSDVVLKSTSVIINKMVQSAVFAVYVSVIVYNAYLVTPVKREPTKKILSAVIALVIINPFISVGLAKFIIDNIIQAYYIPTGAMEDTLKVGDHILVEKVTMNRFFSGIFFVKYKGIIRGDVVTFKPPNEEEKDYIKRCVATGGDDFRLKDGAVLINGEKATEPYAKGETLYYSFLKGDAGNIEGVVPEGKIILLGDNRENSQDSRYFGYVSLSGIKGKAFLLYWNSDFLENGFSRMGPIK